jgi:hypothetical protein
MFVDLPAPGGSAVGQVRMVGWALDHAATTGVGVGAIPVWAERAGEAPRFVGNATLGIPRSDVAAAFGGQFLNSGWFIDVTGLPPGSWLLTANFVGGATGTVVDSRSANVTLTDGLRMHLDLPAPLATLNQGNQRVAGWALDVASGAGSGVGAVHVWALPVGGGAATFLGAATTGVARPDVAAAFGPAFGNAGFELVFALPPGEWDITAYAFRLSKGTFDDARTVRVTVQ